VPILTDAEGKVTPVALVWPATEFMAPKVRAFIDLASDLIKRMVRARDQSA
jgi:DNA-binding transcriptional LysR family regulator